MAEKPNRSPEQIDPKALDSAKNGPDPKFQELLKKQKEFIHELALNKSPAVQKFLKLWFKMNVDYRSYGHSRNPDYRSYGASRLKV
jgi:hypothetical protein